jgi:hypothetical protein
MAAASNAPKPRMTKAAADHGSQKIGGCDLVHNGDPMGEVRHAIAFTNHADDICILLIVKLPALAA